MIRALNTKMIAAYSAFVVGVFAQTEAQAQAVTNNNFSNIAENIIGSIEELPGMITGISYMMGLLLGVLGIIKIKDHVENPSNTPLKDGAVRMAAGGALFALPIVYESMLNTIGTTTNFVEAPELNRVNFAVRP